METKLAAYHTKHDDILYTAYKKNLTLSLQDVREMASRKVAIQNEKEYPIIISLKGIIKSSKAMRHYMATESAEGILLCAVIPKYYTGKPGTKFFFSMEKPAIPHKELASKADTVHLIDANKKKNRDDNLKRWHHDRKA